MPRRPMGRLVLWCDECKAYFNADEGSFDWTCPVCGAYTSKMRCTRCGYSWRPRMGGLPKVCPKCNSWYWNRKRIMKADRLQEGRE